MYRFGVGITEAFSDEGFVKSLFALETAAEVQEALKEKGVELTEQEIITIRELLIKVESGEISAEQMEKIQKMSENGELSDEDLANISGGSFLGLVTITVGTIKILAQYGALIALITTGGIGVGFGAADAVERRW